MKTSEKAAIDPRWNPSYPQRVHLKERPQWEGVLAEWSARVDRAAGELKSKPNRERAERTLAQMQGAVDQIREAARRLPLETGDLYHEDRHRLEEAVAALERMFAAW